MAVYDYITTAGVIVPDTGEVLTQVQDEYKDAFGQDLIVTANTPQGVLINGEALARAGVTQNNAILANQINPNVAGGIFLDAIWALTGGSRIGSTRTVVPGVVLTGIPGTVIPAGALTQSNAGALFQSVEIVTLGIDGKAAVVFESVDFGPVPAPALSLTSPVEGVLGWETVTNPIAGVLGSLQQSDVSSRNSRRDQLALQGMSLSEAITSALSATTGVVSRSYRENFTSSTVIIDGITLKPHSIYVCVDGGSDLDVATTLNYKKTGGTGYNGLVDVAVTDPYSGQINHVNFDRPTLIPVLARVTVKANTSVLDPLTAVKNAILAYANGLIDGEAGFTIGSAVSSFELSGAINYYNPGLFVQKVEISKVSPLSYGPDTIPIEIFQKATIESSGISVIIL